MRLIALIAAALCCSAEAVEIKLAQGTWRGTAAVTLVVDAAGNHSVTVSGPVTILSPSDPVIPTPVPPLPQPGNLTQAVVAGLATVPQYADRDQHRRSIAFGANFIAQAIGNVPVADARRTVRQFCDSAVGGDASKWQQFWVVVDTRLDAMSLTPASYQSALRELAVAITAGLPSQSQPAADTYGVDAYGLDREWLRKLIELLLPLILQLLVRS